MQIHGSHQYVPIKLVEVSATGNKRMNEKAKALIQTISQ